MWKTIKIEGIVSIDKKIAEYRIKSNKVPHEDFKIKIIEKQDGSFLAHPNIAVISKDGFPDYICGVGGSIEDALEDCYNYFIDNFSNRDNLTVDDFVYVEPEIF